MACLFPVVYNYFGSQDQSCFPGASAPIAFIWVPSSTQFEITKGVREGVLGHNIIPLTDSLTVSTAFASIP